MDISTELAKFRQDFDSSLAAELQTFAAEINAISSTTITTDLLAALTAVADGGKRIRPFLVTSMYQAYDGAPSEAMVRQVAVSIELFHLFCLIHDDVIDQATLRHGVPTIHEAVWQRRYRGKQKASRHVAESQAILIGDVLFNYVYQSFIAAVHAETTATSLLRHFGTMVREVCVGQIIDVDVVTQEVVTAAELLEKNTLKTAYYSFVRPLQLGVLLTGKTTDLRRLEDIGARLGMLYQLQDDLLDVTATTENIGKEAYRDIIQGQPTFISLYLATNHRAAYETVQSYKDTELTTHDELHLRELFEATDVKIHMETLIQKEVDAITELLPTLENSRSREFLAVLLTYLLERKK